MDDESRRLKKAWKAGQKQAARAALPLPDAQLQSLFDYLDRALGEAECDHTLRFTREWLAAHEAEDAVVLQWLRDNGGYCDCGVLFNAEQAWQETRG
jgi:hypothetical protein